MAQREWRALYREVYCSAAAEAAEKVTKDGRPVDFYVTTARDRRTHKNALMAYFYNPATTEVTWDPGEFILAKQWLEQ